MTIKQRVSTERIESLLEYYLFVEDSELVVDVLMDLKDARTEIDKLKDALNSIHK